LRENIKIIVHIYIYIFKMDCNLGLVTIYINCKLGLVRIPIF
jgi:hypothetical protein